MDASIKPITLWFKLVDNKWNYNHFSDSHLNDLIPSPISELQKVWLHFKWKKQYAYLLNNYKVIYEI